MILYFEDGPVAQAVANVLPQVLYISAAGNDAERHYQGQYVDSEDGMGSHQISPGNYSFNVIGEEVTVSVQWSNEFDQSGDNYDLCLSTETPEVCASFNDYQDGDDTPIEYATFNCPSGCSLQVRLVSGSPQTLELFFIGGMLVTADQVSTDSIFGHPAVPGVLAIAAIDAYDTGNDDIETFSSRGPSQIFFPSHEIRQKPDVSAIDGVSVTGAGGFPSPFFGTSAAAPHVAGVAALLKAKSTRASNIVNALKNTAVDLGPSGTDNIFGAGRIDAFAAAQYLNQPTVKTMPWIPLLLLDDGGGGEDTIQNGNFESGSTAWTEYSTGGWDIIGTSFPGTVAPHSGSYAAWLGGAYDDTKYIRQTVAVPSSSPTLTFYHWIASAESGCNYDFAYVRVNGSNQLTLGLCSSNNTGGWVPRSINLSGYAGQNISLEFRSVTDSSLNSNWFIDDVSFQ